MEWFVKYMRKSGVKECNGKYMRKSGVKGWNGKYMRKSGVKEWFVVTWNIRGCRSHLDGIVAEA